MDSLILVINAGSSTVKSALFDWREAPGAVARPPLWQSQISFGRPESSAGSVSEAVLQAVTEASAHAPRIDIVGHRVVHGGENYRQSVFVDADVIETIRALERFAPLHNRLNLEGIETVQKALPEALQAAVFDTTFHHTIPDVAAIYPLPYEFYEKQRIKRYGFHGINHQYCATAASTMLGKPLESLNLIVCHLGSGCSVSAIVGGKSLNNTMGFTPLEGLMMGTRSGSIDPGIILHLLRQDASFSAAEALDDLLNKQSGLLGVSGISNDMRELTLAAEQGNARARLAIDMFNHRLRAAIGAMLMELSAPLDALIFTAGIGENSAAVRAAASEALRMLGGSVDTVKNGAGGGDRNIAAAGSAVDILVIEAREDWQIAREAWRLRQGH